MYNTDLISRYNPWNNASSAKFGFDSTAAALLAIQHFNNRDASIVAELGSLECSVTLTTLDVQDSRWDDDTSVRKSIEEAARPRDSAVFGDDFPCVILGPSTEKPSAAVSTVTSALGLPQMVFDSASEKLLSPDSPTTVGVSMNVQGEALAMVKYLQRPGLERDYLAVVTLPGPKTTDLGAKLEVAGDAFHLTVLETSLTPSATSGTGRSTAVVSWEANYKEAVQFVKETGFRTVLLNIPDTIRVLEFAEYLDQANLFTSDFIYILLSDAFPTDRFDSTVGQQQVGSALDKLLTGALIFDRLDGFRVSDQDPFLKAWQSLDASFVSLVNQHMPSTANSFVAGSDYFHTNVPSNYVSFVYDAVMTVGFGGCYQRSPPFDPSNDSNQGSSGGSAGQPPQGSNFPPPNVTDGDDSGTFGGGYVTPNPPNDGSGNYTGQPPDSNGGTGGPGQPPPPPDNYGGGGQPPPNYGGSAQQPPPSDFGGGRSLQSGYEPNNGQQQWPQPSSGGQQQGQAPSGGDPTTATDPLAGFDPLVVAMTEVNITGASGRVRFERGQKFRDVADVTVAVYNVRRKSRRRLADSGSTGYELVVASEGSTGNGWADVLGVVYRDGSTVAPTTTRVIVEPNYLYGWVRGIGLFLMAVAWLLSLGSMVLLYVLRKDSYVQRAQPFFMHLLCFGSFLISVAILTLSFDEGSGWTTESLSAACMATLWFFFLGQIVMFSALFTKQWRLDKVLQFRRGNKVTIRKVIAPLAGLIVMTFVILIVWTIVDPWHWNRAIINEFPAETYGQCECSYFWVFFAPLMAIIILAEVLTAFFAWKTSDVPEDFRDSTAVLYAILTQLQAWVIGVPILAVLGTSSANATYFGRVLLIWIFSISSVGIVVAPRLVLTLRMIRNPSLQKKDRVKVSGLYAPPTASPGQSTSLGLGPSNNNTGSSASGVGRASSGHSAVSDQSGDDANYNWRRSGRSGISYRSSDDGMDCEKMEQAPERAPERAPEETMNFNLPDDDD